MKSIRKRGEFIYLFPSFNSSYPSRDSNWPEEHPRKDPGSPLRQHLTITSDLHDIDGLQTFLPLGDFELNLIAFMKNLETLLLNGRKVHE